MSSRSQTLNIKRRFLTVLVVLPGSIVLMHIALILLPPYFL